MMTAVRQVTNAVLLSLLIASPALAWHIQGVIYCDSNPNGVIDGGDTKLDGVEVKVTSQTADPGHMDFDTSAGGGAWHIDLPAVDDTYKVELTGVGVPGGASVIIPAGGFYSVHLISSSDHKDDADFLLDSCTPVTTTTTTSTTTSTTSTTVTTSTSTTATTIATTSTTATTIATTSTTATTIATTTTTTSTTATTVPTTTTTTTSTTVTTLQSTTTTTQASTTTITTTTTSTTTTTVCTPSPEICNNMQDDDCDGLVDCADPDCNNVPPCPVARKDPTLIRFSRGGLDLIRGHATLAMTPVDLSAESISVLLSNPHEVIYQATLPAGALTPSPKGLIFRFSNPDARTAGGIYSLKIKQRRDGSAYSFSFTSYANLSAATDPQMRLQYYIGEAPLPFITSETPWTRTSTGWRAPKDH